MSLGLTDPRLPAPGVFSYSKACYWGRGGGGGGGGGGTRKHSSCHWNIRAVGNYRTPLQTLALEAIYIYIFTKQ